MTNFAISKTNPVIYAVEAFGGCYEDAWNFTMIATFDKDVAQQYIDNHEIRQQAWNEKGEKFYSKVQKFATDYTSLNPSPVWVIGEKTQEYENWEEIFSILAKDYEKKLANEMGLDLMSDFSNNDDKVHYAIKEINMMEKY